MWLRKAAGQLNMDTYGLVSQVLEKVGYDPMTQEDKSVIEWIEDNLGLEVTVEFLQQISTD